MAEQTVTLPASTIVTDTGTQKRWDLNSGDAILIGTDFNRAGYVGANWLRRIIFEADADGFEFRMILAPTTTIGVSNAGDDLAVEWETNVAALGVAQGANSVPSIPGPNHPDNFLADSSETYRWIIPTGAVATACDDFFFTDLDTSADMSLTFRTPDDTLRAVGVLTGGLVGSIVAAAQLGALPLEAAGTLTGGLTGSIRGAAELVDVVVPDTPMKAHVRGLNLPWAHLPRRWAVTCTIADLVQRVVDSTGVALRELWPATCRPAMLAAWGGVLRRPQRAGETAAAYRTRVATWRAEPVGTSGWVRDEVERVTGDDPPRVLEFPRDGLKIGYDAVGGARIGGGPSLTVGVEPADRAAVEATLEAGVPPDVGINYLEPSVFDAI